MKGTRQSRGRFSGMITSQGRVRIERGIPQSAQLKHRSPHCGDPGHPGTAICSQPFPASLHCPAELVPRHRHPSWHS